MSNVITTTNLSAQGLEKFQQQIASKSQDELQAIAKQQLREIVLKVQDLTKNIEKAKSLTKEANRKNSFWEMINPIADSEEKRRGKLNTQAIALNTETDKQLAELFQSSIVLTTCSFAFARAMQKEIDATIVSGLLTLEDDLKDLSDDHTELSNDHTELSDDVTDFLEKVKERADVFINQQTKYEKRQEKQEQDIDKIHSRLEYKDELDNQQDKKIEALEAELETKRAKITELQGALESKKQIDDSQEQKISALESRVQILESRNNKGGSLSLITSVIALLGALASIALQFLR